MIFARRLDGHLWTPVDSLPVGDRGFRYGMSVFETVAVAHGRLLFWTGHVERLARAVADCGGRLPAIPEVAVPLRASGLLRLYATAGFGGPGDAFCGEVYAFFESAEVGWDLAPVRIASSAAPYLPRPGGWKSGNYWQNIDAWNAARRSGCDEALVFNPAGMLVGASMANIFLLLDSGWSTPCLESGARPGAVREWVMCSRGIGEDFLDAAACASCRAAFLTSSRIGLRPVAELDGRPLEIESVRAFQTNYFHDIFAG